MLLLRWMGRGQRCETGHDRPVPGMVVETAPWGDSGGSWEALADETVSILEYQDRSQCRAGTSRREDDIVLEKEDDLEESKDDLGQAETRRSPPRALETIVDNHPPPGGSIDQDYHGQDTTRRVELLFLVYRAPVHSWSVVQP